MLSIRIIKKDQPTKLYTRIIDLRINMISVVIVRKTDSFHTEQIYESLMPGDLVILTSDNER